ncbi:MFS transporter, partial [[Eubacterium] cellulosolvens]
MLISFSARFPLNKALKGNRLNHALLAGASVSHMLNDLVPQLAPALLPAFIEEFDLSIIQAGQLVSIPFLCGIAALFLGGVLADRINHVSQSIVALSLIGASSFLVVFTRDWVSLVIVFCFILVGNNLFHPAGFSLSSKLFKPERRTTALGFFNAGGILGFAFGPLSVGVFYGLVDWKMIYIFWSLLIVGDVIYLMILKLKKAWNPEIEKPPRNPVKPSLKSVLTLPFIILILIIGIQWLGRHMVLTYFTSFLVFERGFIIQEASIFLSLISIVG